MTAASENVAQRQRSPSAHNPIPNLVSNWLKTLPLTALLLATVYIVNPRQAFSTKEPTATSASSVFGLSRRALNHYHRHADDDVPPDPARPPRPEPYFYESGEEPLDPEDLAAEAEFMGKKNKAKKGLSGEGFATQEFWDGSIAVLNDDVELDASNVIGLSQNWWSGYGVLSVRSHATFCNAQWIKGGQHEDQYGLSSVWVLEESTLEIVKGLIEGGDTPSMDLNKDGGAGVTVQLESKLTIAGSRSDVKIRGGVNGLGKRYYAAIVTEGSLLEVYGGELGSKKDTDWSLYVDKNSSARIRGGKLHGGFIVDHSGFDNGWTSTIEIYGEDLDVQFVEEKDDHVLYHISGKLSDGNNLDHHVKVKGLSDGALFYNPLDTFKLHEGVDYNPPTYPEECGSKKKLKPTSPPSPFPTPSPTPLPTSLPSTSLNPTYEPTTPYPTSPYPTYEPTEDSMSMPKEIRGVEMGRALTSQFHLTAKTAKSMKNKKGSKAYKVSA